MYIYFSLLAVFPGLWEIAFYFLTFSEFSGRGFFCSVWSWYVFLGLGWGWILRIWSRLTPRSVSGLVWVIWPLINGTGHVSGAGGWVWVVFCVSRVRVSSSPTDPPPRSRPGGDLDET